MARPRIADIDLPPDVFAVVMATGIVAIAAGDHQYYLIETTLGVIASAAFVVLTLGLGMRMLARTGVIISQARDPDVALRMFTFVAAAAVLGVHWIRHPVVVMVLGALAAVGWLVLVPLGVRDVLSRPREELRDHAHGAWLLSSVATSGVATTAADLARITHAPWLAVLGMVLWLLALVAYAAVTWLIAWRSVVGPWVPDQVTPDSWILMGALAIAALTGAHIVTSAEGFASLDWLALWSRPATLVIWIVASLWVPVLLYAEVWRVDQRAGSLRFQGVWWSAVFPLGMYSSATAGTGIVLGMPALHTISLVLFWIAVTVWLLVAVGLTQFAVIRRWVTLR